MSTQFIPWQVSCSFHYPPTSQAVFANCLEQIFETMHLQAHVRDSVRHTLDKSWGHQSCTRQLAVEDAVVRIFNGQDRNGIIWSINAWNKLCSVCIYTALDCSFSGVPALYFHLAFPLYNSHLKQEVNFHLLCKVLHQSLEHFSCIIRITDAFLKKDKGTIHTCSRTHHASYLQLQLTSTSSLYPPPFWERRCTIKLLLSGSSSLQVGLLVYCQWSNTATAQ